MTVKQRQERDRQLRVAMAELVRDPRFEHFINHLRDQREAAINDACLDSVVANQRASMAAIGEIRAYSGIIAAYDDFKDQPLPSESAEDSQET
jgi:hypothetical protein